MNISEAKFVSSSTRISQKPKRKLPEFAFIGRSNVGKSSLINMLCSQRKLAMTSATPGKTRLVNHFIIDDSWYLVDLPGYGYAKASRQGKEEIAAVINDFIMNSEELVQLFVLIDARHDITATDIGFINELGEHNIPFAIILTKCDKIGPNVLLNQLERDKQILGQYWEELPQFFISSSQTRKGKEEILNHISNILQTL